MSPFSPAEPAIGGPQPRLGPFRGPGSPARPSARGGRGAAGRLRIMLHRHRWLRWAAAAGAGLAALAALSDDSSDGPRQAPEAVAPLGPSARLPPDTRGVPVPVDSEVLAVGDTVDVHAVLDGAAVVLGAAVVSADADTDEVMLAVPVGRVDATVDALTTGGVILVLVPRPEPPDPPDPPDPDPALAPP